MRGTIEAAGCQLSSKEAVLISRHSRTVVRTGLAIAIPVGTYARIAPCSVLAVKRSIDVGAGVIGADCRGELGAVLINNSEDEFCVQQGDRIAQLILGKISALAVEEASVLGDTSTGLHSGPANSFGGNPGTLSTTNEELSTPFKSNPKFSSVQYPRRVQDRDDNAWLQVISMS